MDHLGSLRGFRDRQPAYVAPQQEAARRRPFALQCLRIAARQTSGNVCLSPASIDAALRVLATGMSTSDRDATLRRLGPNAGPIMPQMGPGYQLSHGTALFANSNVDFLPSFKAHMAELDACLERSDGSLAASKDQINAYVAAHTLGIFTNAFSEADLSKSPTLLVDVIAFRGTWENKFSPKDTERGYNFFASPSHTIKCDMMFKFNKRMPVAETPAYLAVAFHYKMADQPPVCFTAFMPQNDATVDDVLVTLQREGFPRNFHQEQLGRLGLPKFKIEQRHDGLGTLLQQAGLHTLGEPLYVTTKEYLEVKSATQAVSLEVDEEGTVAAAVTSFFIGLGCAAMPQPKRDIIFDKPFAFFIQTGSEPSHLLFAGVFAGQATN